MKMGAEISKSLLRGRVGPEISIFYGGLEGAGVGGEPEVGDVNVLAVFLS